MGERSTIEDVDITIEDEKEFLSMFLAEKLNADADDIFLFDSVRVNTDKKENAFHCSPLIFNWDDWKIQGYWYKNFCKFLVILQKCGVRGTIFLSYSDGSPYSIIFEDDGVKTEVPGPVEIFDITEEGLD